MRAAGVVTAVWLKFHLLDSGEFGGFGVMLCGGLSVRLCKGGGPKSTLS